MSANLDFLTALDDENARGRRRTPPPHFREISEVHILANGSRGGYDVEVSGLTFSRHGEIETLNTHVLFLQGAEELLGRIRQGCSSI